MDCFETVSTFRNFRCEVGVQVGALCPHCMSLLPISLYCSCGNVRCLSFSLHYVLCLLIAMISPRRLLSCQFPASVSGVSPTATRYTESCVLATFLCLTPFHASPQPNDAHQYHSGLFGVSNTKYPSYRLRFVASPHESLERMLLFLATGELTCSRPLERSSDVHVNDNAELS
jgi:hypothetical protein